MNYVGIHNHEYGLTLYKFNHKGKKFPDVDEAIKKCGADVEPENGESFDLISIHSAEEVYDLEKDNDEITSVFPE